MGRASCVLSVRGMSGNRMNWKDLRVLPVAGGLCIALLGVVLARWLGIPLPWLLGPLLLTAATRIAGLPTHCPATVNRCGRWVIGLSLGLYFSPEVAAQLLAYWPLMLLAAGYALVLAVLGSLAYQRFAGLDASTAWFAAAIGTASEMADVAQRKGARADQVVSAHSLRVLLIVVIVPFGFQWYAGDVPQANRYVETSSWSGLALLILCGMAAVWVCRRLKLPNSWMLGPLFMAAALTLNEVNLSSMPSWLSWAGQVCIGWSLGNKYRPDFFRTAPRLLSVVALLTLSFMGLTVLVGWVLSGPSGLQTTVLILAFMPGGVAEMTITAKVLGLGVPLVTAVQVTRVLWVVFSTEPLYRWFVAGRR